MQSCSICREVDFTEHARIIFIFSNDVTLHNIITGKNNLHAERQLSSRKNVRCVRSVDFFDSWTPKGGAVSDATNVKMFSLDLNSETMQIKQNHRIFVACSNDGKTKPEECIERQRRTSFSYRQNYFDRSYHASSSRSILTLQWLLQIRGGSYETKSHCKRACLFRFNLANVHTRNKLNKREQIKRQWQIRWRISNQFFLSITIYYQSLTFIFKYL